jgi:glyoxylase-like metal-dependent hydrolase (beta-lactamase superfamily II)
MSDYGTARADFPGGSARQLYSSIHRILALPGTTTLHLCHDYQPGGRPAAWTSTVAEQRATNVMVRDGISEAEFVRTREARDKSLPLPALLVPAIQVNIRAGHFPAPESNGVSYLKLPVNVLRS